LLFVKGIEEWKIEESVKWRIRCPHFSKFFYRKRFFEDDFI